jgi:hypothetical protein
MVRFAKKIIYLLFLIFFIKNVIAESIALNKGTSLPRATLVGSWQRQLLTVYFGTPNVFITLWFGFDYGTNPPLGKLII